MRSTTSSLLEAIPYIQEIQRLWPELDFADVQIVTCGMNSFRTTFIGETEPQLRAIRGKRGTIMVGYSSQTKTLTIKVT